MSKEPVTQETAPPRREKIRIRVDRLRQSRQRSTIGVAELAGLAGSALLVLAVLFAYLSYFSPARSRLSKADTDRQSLQEKVRSAQRTLDTTGSTRDVVTRISESLDKFENERLTEREEGRLALYNTLIQLIHSNGLRNTSGPTYTYLEPKGENRNSGPRLGNAKWQSLYPGIAVTVTVEGQYANLRHFVRDIEASSQFIIINEVELERAGEEGLVGTPAVAQGPVPATPARPQVPGATVAPAPVPGPQSRSNLVSLKVDMTAYYRRTSESVEAPAQPAGQ